MQTFKSITIDQQSVPSHPHLIRYISHEMSELHSLLSQSLFEFLSSYDFCSLPSCHLLHPPIILHIHYQILICRIGPYAHFLFTILLRCTILSRWGQIDEIRGEGDGGLSLLGKLRGGLWSQRRGRRLALVKSEGRSRVRIGSRTN